MEDESQTYGVEAKAPEQNEARDLISSEKVDGTPVYDRKGEKLGKIHHLMICKRDGQVRYAIMQYGGLFGMGTDYYPLPWESLDYEPDQSGYVLDISEEQLDRELAPSYAGGDEPDWSAEWDTRVRRHYLPSF